MLTIEQKQERKLGLGATDCAVVMGLSPYKTPYELWLEKTGRAEEETILSEDRLRLRHAHEETIAREYAFRNNVKLKRVNQSVHHKRLPFMFCNLDRVVIGQKKIIECKSSTGFMRQMWGEHGSDEAPIHYVLQVQHQLACTDYDDAEIAALIDIDDYRIFPQKRNDKVIQKIEEACAIFWNEHVLKDVPPAPSTRNDLKLMYPLNNGNFIEGNDQTLILLNELDEVKNQSKNLDTEQKRIEKDIIQFIAENDGIKINEEIMVTYLADKKGNRRLNIKKRA